MANFNVRINRFKEFGDVLFYASPSSLVVGAGDTITFTRSDDSILLSAVSIAGFASTIFTSAANISLASNGSKSVKTVKANAVVGKTYLSVSSSGFNSFSYTVDVVSSIDITPDNFVFNNVSPAQPSSSVESNQVIITGINDTTPVSVNTGHFMANNDGNWRTSGSILNGQRLRLRRNASASYNATVSMNCKVGTVTKTWSITTPNDPGSGEVINFPITSGTIKFSDILNFFGGDIIPGNTSPKNLRAYLKGGALVPNITKNVKIPTSGQLKIRDFLGSGTALYFLRYPGFKRDMKNNLNSSVTVEANWGYLSPAVSTNPTVGFGAAARACQYRYKVTESTALGYSSGVASSVQNSVGTFSAWSTEWNIRLSATVPARVERYFGGTVTFQVRSTYNTSVILTATAGYELAGYGR